MPKVSVIVPVYGVEKYIERCARSLFEQTLEDLEYLFIDDCTPDKSIEILKNVLEDYPLRKKQVLIISHENNLGLPLARQSGLKVATGDYIIHCDSDDWVDVTMYEKMYKKAIEEDADVVCCDCKNTDGSNYTITKGGSNTDVTECIYEMMHRKMWWSLCNKLFKRSLYGDNLRYPKDAMGEDMCICLQLMKHVKSIGYVNDVYYNYYTNPNSIVNVSTPEQCLNKYGQLTRNLKIIIESYKDRICERPISNGLSYLTFYVQEMLMPAIKQDKGLYRMWNEGVKGTCMPVILNPMVKPKQRLKALLILLHLFPIRFI